MKQSPVIAVALLCLLSGSGWILLQVYPRQIEFPVAGCIHFAVIGCVAAAYCLAKRKGLPKGSGLAGIALSGMGVFAAPALAVGVSSGAVSEFTSVALFCSIPLLTVLLLGAFEWTGVRGLGPRALLTSVFGMGGAILVFPAQLPSAARGWLFFSFMAACCVLAAVGGIVMHKLIQRVAIATTVALSAFGCAAFLGGYGVVSGWPSLTLRSIGFECLRCLLFDLPVMWLTIWLIREVDPGRLSARFLLIPLITAAEGYAAMGGGVELESGVGMILLAASGVMLLRDEGPAAGDDASSLHLR
jgi:drug/metabolite transporter (DMT)-like permease